MLTPVQLFPRLPLVALVLISAGAVQAQSSVTLSGVVDLGVRNNRNGGGSSVRSLTQDGNSSSRVVFQSDEDLGDGLHAAAWLEMGYAPDSGATNAPFFNRRSLLRMYHDSYGELRLGRDYVPTHWNPTFFDPFVANGVGALYNLVSLLGTTGVFTSANNSVQFFLPPNIGGWYGMAMYAFPEGGSGKFRGFRLGWRSDPINIAGQAGTSTPLVGGPYKTASLGGSYDFGAIKVLVDLDQRKVAPARQRLWSLGAQIPIGVGQVRSSYTRTELHGGAFTGNEASQFALGYVHNLSKRTALYTTYSRVRNAGPGSGGKALFSTNGSQPFPGPTAGQGSTGFEVGLRHVF